jgi:hypothetical protein
LNILSAMKCSSSDFKAAVIGAGIAGASCARALSAAGVSVHVVDKSRGAGGRLATRRLEWLDPQGQRRMARFDHGAPAFAASSSQFRQFLATALQPDALVRWQPVLATGSRPLGGAGPLWLPQPDMPSLCRALLRDIPTSWSFVVDRLQHGPLGWQVESSGTPLAGHFDAVVLALPPAQVAPLLAPHRRDWAQRASIALMKPCWTLMGVARRTVRELHWDVARPDKGPLSWIMRNDTRPGREPRSTPRIGLLTHAPAGAGNTWSSRPTGCSARCSRRCRTGLANRSSGSTPSCIAGAMPCRSPRPLQVRSPTGGTAPAASACAATSSVARASKAPGSLPRP